MTFIRSAAIALSLACAPHALSAQTAAPDISGEITTTPQALHFAMEVVGVPDTPTMRIAELKAQFSPRGNRWEIEFQDGELFYDVTIEQDRDHDLDREIEEEDDIPTFWEPLPAVKDESTPEDYLTKATELLSQFNSSYAPTGRALVELQHCDRPTEGKQSEYENGCRRDTSKQVWTVFIELSAPVRGEERTFFKAITFENGGLPTELTDASVSGNW